MENSAGGVGETYRKTLPKNVFGPPRLRYVSPPPFWRLSVVSLNRKEAPTRPTPISEASKSGFGEHALQYISPLPPIHVIRFALPSAAAQIILAPTVPKIKVLTLRLVAPNRRF